MEGAKLKDKSVPGEYIVETNVDKTVTITFVEKELQELIAEALDPNRSVAVTFEVPEGGFSFGDTAVLNAEIQGYEKVDYTLQWRWSTDNATWNDIADETGETMDVVLTEENYQYYWGVLITVTGLKK